MRGNIRHQIKCLATLQNTSPCWGCISSPSLNFCLAGQRKNIQVKHTINCICCFGVLLLAIHLANKPFVLSPSLRERLEEYIENRVKFRNSSQKFKTLSLFWGWRAHHIQLETSRRLVYALVLASTENLFITGWGKVGNWNHVINMLSDKGGDIDLWSVAVGLTSETHTA